MPVSNDHALSGEGWTSGGEEHAVAYSHADEGLVTMVAAPGSGKRILLTAYHLVAEGNVGVRFQDPDDELTGLMDFAANTVRDVESNGRGLVAGGNNKAMIIYQSAAVQVSGHLKYVVQNKVS